MSWLNLPPRGDLSPLDFERVGDPAIPPTVTAYSALLSDADDNTGFLCQNWDRTKKLVLGCAGRPLAPDPLDTLTAIRIHGRIQLCSIITGTNPRLYALVKRGAEVVGELYAEFLQGFSPVTFDMGWITGIAIPGPGLDGVNSLSVELTGSALGAAEGDITLIVSELKFDYVGNPPVTPRGPSVEIDSEGRSVAIHTAGPAEISAERNDVTIHTPGDVEIDTNGPNEITLR